MYIVVFDIQDEDKRQDFVSAIKKLSNNNWARLSDNAYAVTKTNMDCFQTRDSLKLAFPDDKNSQFCVIEVAGAVAGWKLKKDVWDWIQTVRKRESWED